jgi:isoleucyl-tRNA synthetase
MQRFAVSDLSNFYLDVAKDRLYIAADDDFRRRSCQTTMRHILEGLTTAMAPLLPHMAEDIWQNLPYAKPHTSVFQAGWVDAGRFPVTEPEAWASLLQLRADVNKCMEAGRREGLIGASLEAAVYVHAPEGSDLAAVLRGLEGDAALLDPPQRTNNVDDLRFLLLASQVHLVTSPADVEAMCAPTATITTGSESGAVVGIAKATGKKCARCWFYCETVNTDPELPHICPRCASAVRAKGAAVAQK